MLCHKIITLLLNPNLHSSQFATVDQLFANNFSVETSEHVSILHVKLFPCILQFVGILQICNGIFVYFPETNKVELYILLENQILQVIQLFSSTVKLFPVQNDFINTVLHQAFALQPTFEQEKLTNSLSQDYWKTSILSGLEFENLDLLKSDPILLQFYQVFSSSSSTTVSEDTKFKLLSSSQPKLIYLFFAYDFIVQRMQQQNFSIISTDQLSKLVILKEISVHYPNIVVSNVGLEQVIALQAELKNRKHIKEDRLLSKVIQLEKGILFQQLTLHLAALLTEQQQQRNKLIMQNSISNWKLQQQQQLPLLHPKSILISTYVQYYPKLQGKIDGIFSDKSKNALAQQKAFEVLLQSFPLPELEWKRLKEKYVQNGWGSHLVQLKQLQLAQKL